MSPLNPFVKNIPGLYFSLRFILFPTVHRWLTSSRRDHFGCSKVHPRFRINVSQLLTSFILTTVFHDCREYSSNRHSLSSLSPPISSFRVSVLRWSPFPFPPLVCTTHFTPELRNLYPRFHLPTPIKICCLWKTLLYLSQFLLHSFKRLYRRKGM